MREAEKVERLWRFTARALRFLQHLLSKLNESGLFGVKGEYVCDESLSAVHLHSFLSSSHDAFISRLFRNVHHQQSFDPSSLRLFEACSCKPAPTDLPSSLIKHRVRRNAFLTQPARIRARGFAACPGSVRGEGYRYYGEPKRARSWKRRIQPRQYL